MSNLCSLVLVVFVALLGLTSSSSLRKTSIQQNSEQIQTITVYTDEACSEGESTSNDETYSVPFTVGENISYRANGLWKIEICLESEDEYCDETFISPSQSPNCKIVRATENGELKATRYGEADMSVSHLSVFSEKYFKGTREDVVSSGEADVTLGAGNSFVVTGVEDWAVFSEVNFEGEMECLEASSSNAEYGIKPSFDHPITIKSARPDCTQNPEPTTLGPSTPSTEGPSTPSTEGPSTEGPSTPSTEGPSTPSTEGPSTPSTEGPSTPSTEGPSTPSTEGPSTPSSEGPSTPSSEGPSTPSTEGPSTPSTEGPSTPSTEGPSTPSTAGPSTPSTAGPSTPSTAGPSTSSTAGPSTPSTAGSSTPSTAGPSTPSTEAPTTAATSEPTTPDAGGSGSVVKISSFTLFIAFACALALGTN